MQVPPVQAFPIAGTLRPSEMAVLGYTASETLYYDNANTELFYIKSTTFTYNVPADYAYGWFINNQGNGLTIVYNPFFNPIAPIQQFTTAKDYLLGIPDNDFLLGADNYVLYGAS